MVFRVEFKIRFLIRWKLTSNTLHKSLKMLFLRIFEILFLINCAESHSKSQLKTRFSIRLDSVKPFHCSGSACEGQKLFGECSIDQPYAFLSGRKCCSRKKDANGKDKGQKNRS